MRSRKSVILFAILLFFIGIVAVSINYERSVDLKRNFTAQIINNENRKLIGTEVNGGAPTILPSLEDSKDKNEIVDTSIPKGFSFCDNAIEPNSVTKFPTTGGKTPEVIFTNGACIVFTKEGGEGWECKPGDTLSFSFKKYPSNVVDDQALIIGYIQNKTFQLGETFTELSGKYYTEIQGEGEYFIYVISASSDYLALKEGEIIVS